MARVQPAGKVFFPLASNAHALVAGGPVNSVRARLKVSSLLYDQVLVEAGQLQILAGPSGSMTWTDPPSAESPVRWQTPVSRSRAQSGPFFINMAMETQPGVPATGPYHTVVSSETSICWFPTLEPFQRELPKGCDWITFGNPKEMVPEVRALAGKWKSFDDRNGALKRIVPVEFVRSQLLDHVSDDLATGAGAGWDVSVDKLHGQVIGARFAGDATLRTPGFALPLLFPRVGEADWEDIAKIRRMKAMERFREVLREVESEASDVAINGGDLEEAMRSAYTKKLVAVARDVEGIGSVGMLGLLELVVGAVAEHLTMGLAFVAVPAGAAVTAALRTGVHGGMMVRQRGKSAWLGIHEAISDAAAVVR